jgi:hypothetical protein
MGLQHRFDQSGKSAWRTLLLILVAVSLTGCGTALLGGADNTQIEIWKHRDQFVRIEAQDAAGTIPPNDHPAQLDAANLRAMLGSLQVRFAEKSGSLLGGLKTHILGDEKPVTMFTDKELAILGDALSTSLAQAGPRQDITFVIVGIHRELIGFSHDRAFITGRVFVQDGKLNLIIGSLHKGYEPNLDRRMFPFVLGSRQYKAPSTRKEAPRAWQPVPVAGLKTPTIDGQIRHDWLILDTDPEVWKAAQAIRKEAGEAAKAAFQEASQVREESTQISAEQQRLRSEIQEMKQTIQEMKQAPVKAAPPAVAAPAPVAAPTPGVSKIEQRLELLRKLKTKGLITDEEYQGKKKEILDSL